MKRALIHNNSIVQVSTIDFEVHPDLRWVDCPDDCTPSWLYSDGNVFPPDPPTLEQLKESRKAESARLRYAAETSGVTVNGRLFLTTREDVRILESAIDKIRRGLVTEMSWKCGDGKFIKLKANNINSIEVAILTHIQNSFEKEAQFSDAIGTCTTIEELSAIILTY